MTPEERIAAARKAWEHSYMRDAEDALWDAAEDLFAASAERDALKEENIALRRGIDVLKARVAELERDLLKRKV